MGGVGWGRTSNRRGNFAGNGRIDAHDRFDRMADGRAAYTPFPNYEETVDGAAATTRVTYSLAGQAVAIRVTGDPNPENNGLFYLYNDHLGSAGAIQKSDGSSTIVTQYTPFGGYRLGSGPNEVTDRGFTGHKQNDDLGLIYMNARYYVPGIARFASADTLVPDPANPQSLNRYSYVLNSPVNGVDPDGHCYPACTAIAGGIIGGIVGGATYLITTPASERSWGEGLLATAAGAAGGALIGTGIGISAATSVAAPLATTVAAASVGAGSGTVISAETYMFTNDQFDSRDFTISVTGGALEGGLTGAIPGSGFGPALSRAAISSVIAGGEQIAGDLVHNTSSPGFLKTMAFGFGTGILGEAFSGGFKGRNATKLPFEMPSAPEIRPTQWLDPLVNGREIQNAIKSEYRNISRTIIRDITFGSLTGKLLPQ